LTHKRRLDIFGRAKSKFLSFILYPSFLSYPFILSFTRYVELNPVRAGMVKNPQAWRWSSAHAHSQRKNDILVRTKPLLAMIKSPWKKFLSVDIQKKEGVPGIRPEFESF
jgi:putative transposase